MNNRIELSFLIFSLLFRFSCLCAEENQVVSDSIEAKYFLNPIIKTATKVAGAQRDLAASITLISGSKLRGAPTSQVFELVQNQVPGFFVTEWGLMGFGVAGSSAGKISIRGLGGTADTHVLILRNGRPDFMGLMGCTIADEFSTDGIERIEVVRGPASFLYGTNATAGVINIVSQKIIQKGFKTRFLGGVGSHETQKLTVNHGGKIGDFDYLLTLATRRSDGHRTDGNGNYQGQHYTLHMGYQPTTRSSLELNASFANFTIFDPGPIQAPLTDGWHDIQRWGGDFTISHKSSLGESNLKIHGNFGKHRFYDGWTSLDRMIGIMAYHNIQPIQSNTTTMGVDSKQYGGHGENNSTGPANVPYQEHQLTEIGPYIHTQQLIFKKLIGSAGLRIENHDLFGSQLLPKIGLVAHLSNATSCRITSSKGFRSPSIRELYFFPTHNEFLKPDVFWNYEVGFSHRFGRKIKLDGAIFHIRGNNLITLVQRIPGPGFQLTNSGEVRNTGYELILDYLIHRNLEVGMTWSQTHMKVLIPNAPEKKLTSHITVRVGHVSFEGTLLLIRDWFGKDNAKPVANVYTMPDYTLVHCSATGKIYGPMGFKLGIKNILDTEYQAMYGYPMPGRHLTVDLTTQF